MEIPVVNRIMDFEANLNPLDNPSLLSPISVSGIGKAYQTYNLWKWGALILALIASLSTIINRIKLWISRLQNYYSLASQQHAVLDDDDYESETESSVSFSDDEDEEEREDEEVEDEPATTSFCSRRQVGEDFRVRGSGHVYIDEQWQKNNSGLRRRRSRRSIGDWFSWSELTSGKSVVKLWDNLGLGLGLNAEESSENELTIYDMNEDREIRKIASIYGRKDEIPAFVSTSSSAPGVIFSAITNDIGCVALSGWDTRISSKLPTILAEWRPKLGNIVRVESGVIEEVYVRNNVTNALTVGDIRKVNWPLDDEVDTWWDADAVVVTEDYFHDTNE